MKCTWRGLGASGGKKGSEEASPDSSLEIPIAAATVVFCLDSKHFSRGFTFGFWKAVGVSALLMPLG